jgi:hypothetical protein
MTGMLRAGCTRWPYPDGVPLCRQSFGRDKRGTAVKLVTPTECGPQTLWSNCASSALALPAELCRMNRVERETAS